MNIFLNFINIKNNIIISLIISRRYKINLIIKFELKKNYSINFKNYFEFILIKFVNLINFKFNKY